MLLLTQKYMVYSTNRSKAVAKVRQTEDGNSDLIRLRLRTCKKGKQKR